MQVTTLLRAQGEIMYTLAVSELTDSKNPYKSKLLDQLKKSDNQRARVYYTYIEADPEDVDGLKDEPNFESFTFITTSKDIHLGLGQFGYDGQIYLVGFLEHEFKRDEHMSQMILFLNEGKGSLVTRTVEIDGTVVFTLAPA